MAAALLVALAAAVLLAVLVAHSRRRSPPPVQLDAAKYRVVIEGYAPYETNDSRVASIAIEIAKKEGRAWKLLVDGVEKKNSVVPAKRKDRKE